MKTIVAIFVVVLVIVIIILALLACRFARKGKPYQEVELNQSECCSFDFIWPLDFSKYRVYRTITKTIYYTVAGITTVRSLKFKFKTIKSATKKFSDKIGQGGFGSVFKVSSL